MPSLSLEEVKSLAVLARLELSETELEKLQQDLDSILGYVDRLQKIDTQGVLEGSSDPVSSFRADKTLPVDDAARELILSNFPDRVSDALGVPAVFEKPKE